MDGSDRLPSIPGHEVSGVVQTLSTGVTDLREGDEVYIPGPTSTPECRSFFMARGIPAAKSSTRLLSVFNPPRTTGRGVLGAMCFGVSEPCKRMFGCVPNLPSPQRA